MHEHTTDEYGLPYGLPLQQEGMYAYEDAEEEGQYVREREREREITREI
jgi:hypothetical protein